MRHLYACLALLLLAAPLGAQSDGFFNNGDGTSDFSVANVPNKLIIGLCGTVPGWVSGDTLCDGSYLGKSFVELGVCDVATTDPLPTQPCTQGLVNMGVCPNANWIDKVIPQAGKCGPVATLIIRRFEAERARSGLRAIWEINAAAVSGDDGEFGDD